MLRVGPLTALPPVLRHLGFSPERVLADAGYPSSAFDCDTAEIPFADQCKLVVLCAEVTCCPHLGLLIGQRCQLDSLGTLGLLLKRSNTVGDALRALIRYERYQLPGVDLSLHEDGKSACLRICVRNLETPEIYDDMVDGVTAGLCSILREFLGDNWSPTQVLLSHGTPHNDAPFRNFFRCPVGFGAVANGLVFQTAHLNKKLDQYDPELCLVLKAQLAEIIPPGDDLPNIILTLLRMILPTYGTVRVDKIAEILGFRVRTLHRRLHASGTTFLDLVDQARFCLSRRMLSEQGATISEIAEFLAFSEPSAFVRAFRRWSGMTPVSWRDRMTGGTEETQRPVQSPRKEQEAQ